MNSRLIQRNVVVFGRRTSLRLEPEFWDALVEIGKVADETLTETIEMARSKMGNGGLTSAVCVYVLQWFRAERSRRAGEGR